MMGKRYHLFKKSRVYVGYPYCGPTSGGDPAETDSLDEAVEMRKVFAERNPVGWDIYDSVENKLVRDSEE